MSCIEEYSEQALQAELDRRRRMRDEGLCAYCQRPWSTSPCRVPSQHGPPFGWYRVPSSRVAHYYRASRADPEARYALCGKSRREGAYEEAAVHARCRSCEARLAKRPDASQPEARRGWR